MRVCVGRFGLVLSNKSSGAPTCFLRRCRGRPRPFCFQPIGRMQAMAVKVEAPLLQGRAKETAAPAVEVGCAGGCVFRRGGVA